jgi:hypothetical protein
VPDLVVAAEDARQVVDNVPGGTGAALERAPTDDEAQQAQAAGQPAPASVPLTIKDLAQEKLDEANTKAQKAEDRIADWMVEAKYPMQMRKVVFDSARLGGGCAQGPVPDAAQEARGHGREGRHLRRRVRAQDVARHEVDRSVELLPRNLRAARTSTTVTTASSATSSARASCAP